MNSMGEFVDEIYSRSERTQEDAIITVTRYRVNGDPACVSWHGSKNHKQAACMFHWTRKW